MKTNYMNIHTHIMHFHYCSCFYYSFISDYITYSYMPLSKCSLSCELMNVSNN